MKNPFYLTAVYKTFEGGELKAEIRVPYPKEGVPEGAKCPVFIEIPSEAGLGVSYSVINKKHNDDLVARRYVVVTPEYRTLDGGAAASSLLQGPVQDCRDLLAWIHEGGLQWALEAEHPGVYAVDCDRVYASGVSYGGLLALSLGWDVPRPVSGILDVCGPCHFADDWWKASYDEKMAGLTPQQKHADPTSLGLPAAPNSSLFDVVAASSSSSLPDEVDPALHVHAAFPPVFIVHGQGDDLVPVGLSRHLLARLQEHGVRCELAEVEGAAHLFASTLRESPEAVQQVSRGVDFLTSQ